MRTPRRSTQSEQGAVAIMVAILSVALIGVLAFVTDIGMAYANKRILQNGADAAVLAVGNELIKTSRPNETCAEMATREGSVQGIASSYLEDNAQGSAVSLDGYSLDCEPMGLVVSATATKQSPAFFGGIFGSGDIPLAQSAKAIVGPAGAVVGVRPIAICSARAALLLASPTTTMTFDVDNVDQGCGSAAGNWGLLDLDGGSNPTGDLEKWIGSGSPDQISSAPGTWLHGNPGIPRPGALAPAMDSILGKIVILPVFDQMRGSGQGSEFQVTGFISVRMCAYKFNNQKGDDTYVAGDDIDASGSCWSKDSVPVPEPKNYFQVKFRKYIPMGELNTACVLGSSCDGIRLAKLAD